MVSVYIDRPTEYIVRVLTIGRGRKLFVKQSFTNYDEAMEFMDKMEAMYSDSYMVEFDTKFRFRAA